MNVLALAIGVVVAGNAVSTPERAIFLAHKYCMYAKRSLHVGKPSDHLRWQAVLTGNIWVVRAIPRFGTLDCPEFIVGIDAKTGKRRMDCGTCTRLINSN